MPLWLIIVLVVLVILVVGGIIARNRQLARSRPAFERALARVDHDLAAAAAADRGWGRARPRGAGRRVSAERGGARARLGAAARRISAERFGSDPDELTLVEVIDKPGTEEDQAVFDVSAGGSRHRAVLGRRDGDWVGA